MQHDAVWNDKFKLYRSNRNRLLHHRIHIPGCDFGFKKCLTGGDGTTIASPEFRKAYLKLLASVQRRLSWKQWGSHRYEGYG